MKGTQGLDASCLLLNWPPKGSEWCANVPGFPPAQQDRVEEPLTEWGSHTAVRSSTVSFVPIKSTERIFSEDGRGRRGGRLGEKERERFSLFSGLKTYPNTHFDKTSLL